MGRKSELGLLEIIEKIEGCSIGTTQRTHVKAHTGKLCDIESWDKDTWGNHIADCIAGGDTCEQLEVTIIRTSASSILQSLERHLEWFVGSAVTGTLATHNLDSVRDSDRLVQYISDRDSYRVMQGRSPKWDSVRILGSVRINRDKAGLMSRVSSHKTFWDKVWHGGNVNKGIKDSVSSDERELLIKCPLCIQLDNQDHQFRHCSGGSSNALQVARSEVIVSINKYISKCRGVYDNGTLMLLEAIREVAFTGHNGYEIWLGRWSDSLIHEVETLLGDKVNLSSFICNNFMKRAYDALMRVFSTGWKKLWKVRCHLIKCNDDQSRIEAWKALKVRQSSELAIRAANRKRYREEIMRLKKAALVRSALKVLDISSYFLKNKVKTRVHLTPVGRPIKKTAKARSKIKKNKNIN
jgi:hypothetical protein